MADSNKTVRFTIKTVTEGGQEVQALDVNVKDLAEAIEAAQSKAKKGIKIGANAIGMDAVINMIGKLNSVIQDLSEAYKVQEQAENKLATSMKNTLMASDAEIDSIKELCRAQQELGVLGDEVQLQGAEKLSTYLETADALKALIPLMNDLTVKQYGMDASGENSAATAALLGKAMQGNVTALKRLGIEFTDSQKVILEYGDEMQKVALLTDVVGAKVNGMNAEMAKTDSGKMKQFENTMGDLKEQIGQVAIKIAPLINMATQFGTVLLSTAMIVKGYNILMPVMVKVNTAASASLKRLGISIRGLMIATGVGAAIAALTWIISELMDAADDAADSMDNLTEAEKRALQIQEDLKEIADKENEARETAKTAIKLNIERLKQQNLTKEQEKKLVKEMNSLYGDTMGYYSSVNEWLKALTANSEAYCNQLAKQARMEELIAKIRRLEKENEDIDKNKDSYSTKRDENVERLRIGRGFRTVRQEIPGTSEYEIQMEKRAGNLRELIRLYDELDETSREAFEMPEMGSTDPNIVDPEKKAEEAKKAEKERRKAKEDADKKIIEMQKKQTADYIAAMEDGDMKQLALIGKAYSDKMDEIARKEKELTDLRIKEGKTGLEESEKELFDFARELAEKEFDKAFEALTPLAPAAIKTYEELTKTLNYWNNKFNKANAEERKEIRQTIDALESLKESFDFGDVRIGEIKTYDELSKALSYWESQFNKASENEREQIRKTIAELEKLKASFDLDTDLSDRRLELDNMFGFSTNALDIQVKEVGMDGWLSKLKEMQRIMADPTATESQKRQARELAEEYRQLASQCVNYFDVFSSGWGGLKGVGNGIKSLTDALNGQKDAWETLVGVIDSILNIYQSVMQVIDMMNTLSEVFNITKNAEAVVSQTTAAAKMESAAEEATASGVVTAANEVETKSFVKLAAAQYMAAHASIPFTGYGIGAGFVAALTALMEGLNAVPFADGGIVSGPTLGLMGEYAGASSNPEVIAPLDKLKSMLGETGGGMMAGRVVFEIDGKKLVGVLGNTTRISAKSGKRTNIKI